MKTGPIFALFSTMIWTILAFSLLGSTCQAHSTADSSKPLPVKLVSQMDTSFQGVRILIKLPDPMVPLQGDLLLLPGWNYSNTKWCDSSEVCRQASAKGYRVIAPQMGQSIYASRYFPETRKDLAKYPTLLWLDSAINFLRDSMNCFRGKNLVLGLSTGARGVALICGKRPGFFAAAAALSGDYNQLGMPNDPLCTLVYGPFKSFANRWKLTDNPEQFALANGWETPLYLGHGSADRVVPVAQTTAFAAALKRCKHPNGFDPAKDLVLHINPAAGHTFGYWRSELDAVWHFFDTH